MNLNFIQNILEQVEIPENGTLSRAVHSDDHVRAILFAFDAGQELSEHTASMPAIIHILQGEATLSFDGESQEAQPGTWAHMAANLPHSVYAKTPLIMLLLLLKM